MKVLVATAVGQGMRNNDYNWCIEGELVRVGLVCATDQNDPDGGCGCGRGFGGLSSHRATTTARVAEVRTTLAEYATAIRDSLREQGWGDFDCTEEARELAAAVADWPVGTIVARRLDELVVRAGPNDFALRR